MKQLKTAVMYGVAALVSCTVRICQLLFMTDPDTGFFYERFETLGTALTVLYVAIFAVCAVVAFSEMRGTVKLFSESIPRSVVMFIAAVFFLLEIPQSLMASDPILLKVFFLAAELGAVAFFALEGAKGISRLEFTDKMREGLSWSAIFPAAFWLAKAVLAFSHYMTVANISENVFDLIAMGFLTVFFLAYGKMINGIDTKFSTKIILPLGVCTSLVCLICSVPRYAARVFAVGVLHETAPPDVLYIVLAVAVLLLLPRRISRQSIKTEE